MGSSKKHKDKDRDRDHKKKKRHRSRSRSRSKEPKERKRRRDDDKKSKRKERAERDVSEEREELWDMVENFPTKSEQPQSVVTKPSRTTRSYDDWGDKHSEQPAALKEEPPASRGGSDVSLSIEETNKLRAKLGLKPLDVGVPALGDTDEAVKEENQDVHVPAVNWAEVKKTEEIREKMAQAKMKRKYHKKLQKVKTLGESDSEDEGAKVWVKKSRKIQTEKDKAEHRAKVLEEMDKEFGIGGLVEEAFAPKQPKYTSRDLRGLRVQHDTENFQEGRSVILTLEDKGVLDKDGEDVLVNVNMMDDERAVKNVENKKKKPDYNPYDDPEEDIDELGMWQQKNVLGKYDEHHKERKQFALGAGGKYNAEHERKMKEFKAAIKQRGETLRLAEPQIASEYYTTTEMEGFKKVTKKTRKIRKKKIMRADDLLPLDDVSGMSNLRSRRRHGDMEEGELETSALIKSEPIPGLDLVEQPVDHVDMEIDEADPLDDVEILGPEEDLTGVPVEDEPANELAAALYKTRRLKQQKRANRAERILSQQITSSDNREPEREAGGVNIVLNSTSEFCRSLGEIPTYGMAGNREEDEDELLDFENELMEERKKKAELEDQALTGWQSVEIDTRPVDIKEGEEPSTLDEEVIIDTGISSALKLSIQKGYLIKEENKKANTGSHSQLGAQHYSIEDKRYDDLDEKYRKRGDRFSGGMTVDFKELETFKPDVKLNYVDESGRQLTSKEAFRQLSHRFHGKGSGKKKQEKRTKKLEQESLLKNASSTDTPLGTVEMLREKQKVEKSPFIVLSGGGSKAGLTSFVKMT